MKKRLGLWGDKSNLICLSCDKSARISPMANIQNELLDFVIVKDFPKWQIPLFLLKVARGKTHLSKYVEIIQCQKMQISAKNTLLHLDGEPFIANNPVEIKLIPKSLKILIPNEKEKQKGNYILN